MFLASCLSYFIYCLNAQFACYSWPLINVLHQFFALNLWVTFNQALQNVLQVCVVWVIRWQVFDKTGDLLEFQTKLALLVVGSRQYGQAFEGRNLKDQIVNGLLIAVAVNRVKIAEG